MPTAETPVPLPESVRRLPELANDLWWTWNDDARDVFRRLDYASWRATQHNPVRMLPQVPPERFAQVAGDPKWMAQYERALEALDAARASRHTWFATIGAPTPTRPIAYFSAEFALHQSLPIYAGGLGVLAGDHCKEASDLGVPLIGIGFMYPQGYFHQHVSVEGAQQEIYETLDWHETPIRPRRDEDDKELVIAVPLGNRTVLASVWEVKVGGVRLYLLDTNLEENAPWDRELSARLYGGDRETRVQQEIILGIGGVRLVRALGYDPAVWHLNEGHAAFVVLQRIRELLDRGAYFEDALEEVRRSTVFTTHTPVPAGHDAFPFHMVETHLAGCWGSLGPHREDFLALGTYDSGSGTLFNMTALALRSSGMVNAVSQVHREVTREMWAPIWPDIPRDELPVTSVTNGVHLPTWIAADLKRLYDRYAPDWRERTDEPATWDGILDIPDAELWQLRMQLREFLFGFIRERMRLRWTHELVMAPRVVAGGTLLDPYALTLGFARRFTGYKRPELIFHDPDRLRAILNHPRRPVQIVFAGKAHPHDESGKRALQAVYAHAIDPTFAGRVAFVDNYDLHVAHYFVQGCDVWLNNPRKPLEASGTSGMKACCNGVPHLSIGDGWWAEGYTGENGWLIDPGVRDDPAAQDAADAEALYALIERDIVPAFYRRDDHDVPTDWVRVVKQAIRTVAPRFSSRRMVKEYVERMYLPAMREVQPRT